MDTTIDIVGIIVTALPSTCEQCPLSSYNDYDGDFCYPIHRKLTNFPIRPNWCPLITEKRILKLWRYAEVGDWDYEKESEYHIIRLTDKEKA